MIISITSGRYTLEQSQNTKAFLEKFLPKVRSFPGVKAVYHFEKPDKNEESTIIIWESEEALKHYRDSDLVKEAIAFEKTRNLPTTREAYPLLFSL
jgi:heme-degrading monooxygenase HmoA